MKFIKRIFKLFFDWLDSFDVDLQGSILEPNDNVQYKEAGFATHYLYVCPILITIMNDMADYAAANSMQFTVTSFVRSLEENEKLGAVSSTHTDGRAFDIRTRYWTLEFVEDFCKYFNKEYKKYAAISKNGEANLCIYHNNGNGNHIHVQVHKRYSTSAHMHLAKEK